jgi:hypothetical protein
LAVIAVFKILKHREYCVAKLQAFSRGFIARLHIHRYKMKLLHKFNRAAMIITKFFSHLTRGKVVVIHKKVNKILILYLKQFVTVM